MLFPFLIKSISNLYLLSLSANTDLACLLSYYSDIICFSCLRPGRRCALTPNLPPVFFSTFSFLISFFGPILRQPPLSLHFSIVIFTFSSLFFRKTLLSRHFSSRNLLSFLAILWKTLETSTFSPLFYGRLHFPFIFFVFL